MTVALAAFALTGPTSALAGWPASEKTAGVEPPTGATAPITSEKLAGLPNIVPISDETGAPRDATHVPSADDKVIVHTPITWLYPDAPEA